MPFTRITTILFYRYTGPVPGPVFFLTALILCLSATVAHAQAMLLPTDTFQVGERTIRAEIAATPEARRHGLMGRNALPTDHGMLFVFDQADLHCFWMKDTPLALSIAFINPQGHIVSIADMQPFSLDTHCPDEPVRYALEMPQNWFARAGVKPGDAVAPLPPPDTHK